MESTEAVSLEETPVPDESKEIRIAASPAVTPLLKHGNESATFNAGPRKPNFFSGVASQPSATPQLPIPSRTLSYPLDVLPQDKYGLRTQPLTTGALPPPQNYMQRVTSSPQTTIDGTQNPEPTHPLPETQPSGARTDEYSAKKDDSSSTKLLADKKPKGAITKQASRKNEVAPVHRMQSALSHRPQSSYRTSQRAHGFEEEQRTRDSKIRMAELSLQQQNQQQNQKRDTLLAATQIATLRLQQQNQQQNQKRDSLLAATQIATLRLQQRQQRQQEILAAGEISALNRRASTPVVQREIQIIKVPSSRHEDDLAPLRNGEFNRKGRINPSMTPKHVLSDFSTPPSETHPELHIVRPSPDVERLPVPYHSAYLPRDRPIIHEPNQSARHSGTLTEAASQVSPQPVRHDFQQSAPSTATPHHIRLPPPPHAETLPEPHSIRKRLSPDSKEHHAPDIKRQQPFHKREDAMKIYRIDDEGGIHRFTTSRGSTPDSSTNAKRSRTLSPTVVRVDQDGGLHYPRKHRSQPLPPHRERLLRALKKEHPSLHVHVKAPTSSRQTALPPDHGQPPSEKTHNSHTPTTLVGYLDEDGGIHPSTVQHLRHPHSMENLSKRDGRLDLHHKITAPQSLHIRIPSRERSKHHRVFLINNHDSHMHHFHLRRPPHGSAVSS